VRRGTPVVILVLAAPCPHGEHLPDLYDAYLGTRLLALTVKERDQGRVTFEPSQDAPLSFPVVAPAAQMLPAYTESHRTQSDASITSACGCVRCPM
jgi:hypothetical protein